MQEVVCYTCGRIVHISPDAELCSVCGENLRELLHPVYASKYFYDRAAQLAAGDQLQPALQEIDRGLRYQPSSELRLLGAILAKRLGDFDQMRSHVAAIPVDDILRPEGEWLLRSHQVRQRALREASKGSTTNRTTPPFVLDPEPSYTTRPGPATVAVAPRPATTRRVGYLAVVAGLLFVVVGSSVWLARNTQFVTALFNPESQTSTIVNYVATPVQPAQGETADSNAPTSAAPPVVTPTATTAPDVPANVVKLVPTATSALAEVADSTPGAVVDINATQLFDLAGYLQGVNRPDLVQLGVSASIQGSELALQGIVPSYVARQTLIDLAKDIPGVETVRDVDLLLRPPPTYIVQPGDTLWDITYQLYGDVSKIPVLLAANRDQLPSPESLRVGMELKVPPVQ